MSSQSSEGSHCLIVAISCHEPARGLWQEQHHSGQERAKDDLERNGEAPSEIGRTVTGSKVDPVCDQCTDGDNTALNTDQQPAVGSLGALSLICRNGRCVDAVSHSSDRSTDNELSHCAFAGHGSNLNDDADDHDETTHDDSTSSSENIAEAELEDGASEAANLVDCGYKTLPRRVASSLRECVVELGRGDDTGHDALVVPELSAVSTSRFMVRGRKYYPKSKKPLVATTETSRDNDLPESPRKVGMPCALSLDDALPKPMIAI